MIDPRPEREGQIRYIGKSEDFRKRKQTYLSDIRKGSGHSPSLQRWFAKLKRLGLLPVFTILQACSADSLDECERTWIDEARMAKWPLLNCREGGSGGRLSDETKARISEIGKAKWADPEYVARRKQADVKRWGTNEEREARRYKSSDYMGHARLFWNYRAARRRAFLALPNVPLTYRGSAFVPLTGGAWAKVDLADWQMVSERNWYANQNGKRVRAVSKTKGRVFLHQLVGGKGFGPLNGDPLDCRRCNLAPKPKQKPRPASIEHLERTLRGMVRRSDLQASCDGLRRRINQMRIASNAA